MRQAECVPADTEPPRGFNDVTDWSRLDSTSVYHPDMKLDFQTVTLCLILLSSTSSALSDYSSWLQSLLTQRSVAVKAKAKISRPYAGAVEYEITSRPEIAKVIGISLRDKNPRYWTMVFTNPKAKPIEITGKANFSLVQMGDQSTKIRVDSGKFSGAIMQENEAVVVGNRRLAPAQIWFYSRESALDKCVIGC
jgi:hypothetical protein